MASTTKAYLMGGDLDGATLNLRELPARWWGTYTPKSMEEATWHETHYGSFGRHLLRPVFYERAHYDHARKAHVLRFHGYQVPDGVSVIIADAT
jgi:hypothetical protein